MSCSLCRLPFQPTPRSNKPRPAPPGILTDKQRNYLQWAIGMGKNVPAGVATLEYLDNNMFGNVPGKRVWIVSVVMWETHGGTIVTVHSACGTLLRHAFGLPAEESIDSMTELSQIELVLGRPLGGRFAGRLRHVDYERVGKFDIEKFWIPSTDEGLNAFNWTAFMSKGLDWMLNRPDVFPKFYPVVSPSRLSQFKDVPKAPADILTTQSLDVLHLLLPYLSDESFVYLLSSCRLLRHHALTTFQPHARKRVLALGWAVPLETERARAAPAAATSMAHPEDSPADGDWLLYLSQVYKKPSMRARRRIWALAHEVYRVYRETRASSEYEVIVNANGERIKTTARIDLEKHMEFMMQMRHASRSETGSVLKRHQNRMS